MVDQNIWDILITTGVVLGIVLMVVSAVTKMTVKEMITYIKEIMGDTQEEVFDNALILTE